MGTFFWLTRYSVRLLFFAGSEFLIGALFFRASYADYEWSANAPANKPSTPFKIFEKEKPRPGTAEAEIEG